MADLKKTIAVILLGLFILGIGFYTIWKNIHVEKGNDTLLKDNIAEKRYENLEEAIKEGEKINILMLGVEDEPRSDTIILICLDPEKKRTDLVFIPRDTYYHEEGWDRGDQRKLNAVYGRGGAVKSIEAVKNILRPVPIHHYMVLRYSGVEEIVRILGGVEVNVPKGVVNLKPGKQVLNGEQSVQFLRFRAGYSEGDLGRIKAQQEFIRSAIHRVSISQFPRFAKEVFPLVKTDIGKKEMIHYSFITSKIDKKNIFIHRLPGIAKYESIDAKQWSYFYNDPKKTRKFFEELYEVKKNN